MHIYIYIRVFFSSRIFLLSIFFDIFILYMYIYIQQNAFTGAEQEKKRKKNMLYYMYNKQNVFTEAEKYVYFLKNIHIYTYMYNSRMRLHVQRLAYIV